MTRTAIQPDLTCNECGAFGAYAFDGEALCLDCYQARGSCCAERACGDVVEVQAGVTTGVASLKHGNAIGTARSTTSDTLRVNPNCCYQACPRCSHLQRLREFRSRFPHDWQTRLRGLSRIVALAAEAT